MGLEVSSRRILVDDPSDHSVAVAANLSSGSSLGPTNSLEFVCMVRISKDFPSLYRRDRRDLEVSREVSELRPVQVSSSWYGIFIVEFFISSTIDFKNLFDLPFINSFNPLNLKEFAFQLDLNCRLIASYPP